MRSDSARSQAYNAKTAPTTLALKYAARLPGMKSSFTAATTALVTDQLATAAILDAAGIFGMTRGRYHAFSNRLHRIKRLYDGVAAQNFAQVEHDRWESTCQSAIMITIALQVYGFTVA